MCKDQSSGEIKVIILGLIGFPPYILLEKHDDRLLSIILDNKKNDGTQYMYIHTLAPFILDVWNMQNSNRVFLCYYKNFGELINCPISSEKLFANVE